MKIELLYIATYNYFLCFTSCVIMLRNTNNPLIMLSYARLRDLLYFLVLKSTYKEFSEQQIITYLLFAAQRGIQLNMKIDES